MKQPFFQLLFTALVFQASMMVARGAEQKAMTADVSLEQWMMPDGSDASQHWEIHDGMIHLKEPGNQANILTKKLYGDFDLRFEWKIAPGGNSGIKYRVQKYGKRDLGLEYQLYDDVFHAEKLRPKNGTGSIYDLIPPDPAVTRLKPVGEFNQSRILVQGNRIQHWLNGYQIVDATVGSPAWDRAVAASKFADKEQFGENHLGRIMLTDHNSQIWFRNLELTSLETPTVQTKTCPVRPRNCRPRTMRRVGRLRCLFRR